MANKDLGAEIHLNSNGVLEVKGDALSIVSALDAIYIDFYNRLKKCDNDGANALCAYIEEYHKGIFMSDGATVVDLQKGPLS